MTDQPGGTDAPAWFRRALAAAPEHRDLEVDGARVHYRVWGRPGLPGLVLVHGGAAHSGWWDHIAPQLASHRVVALDLTGHGDSDHREVYDMRQWAREVLTVAAAEDLDRPVVVGHSMGGWVAITVGVHHGELLSAAAYIDSPLIDASPEEEYLRHLRRPTRVYGDPEDAVARFRTLPEQEVILPYIGAHVARSSLRPVEGGWTWKFDPEILGRTLPLRDLLPRLRCPAALFACEHGMVAPAMAAEMARLVPGRMPVVDVPDAGHHPMLDQPLSLVTGLRTLLALWPAAANAG